jgi:hypothetical protein
VHAANTHLADPAHSAREAALEVAHQNFSSESRPCFCRDAGGTPLQHVRLDPHRSQLERGCTHLAQDIISQLEEGV